MKKRVKTIDVLKRVRHGVATEFADRAPCTKTGPGCLVEHFNRAIDALVGDRDATGVDALFDALLEFANRRGFRCIGDASGQRNGQQNCLAILDDAIAEVQATAKAG